MMFSATLMCCCNFLLKLLYNSSLRAELTFCNFIQSLFYCLMEFFKPSESYGFLLLYFLLILILGKCFLYISTRCLWNVSKACCVSAALLISPHFMLLMARQKLSLFREFYNFLYTYASFSLISICLAIWNTGKWSNISVMNNSCTKWFILPILLVNILSISVTDMTVTLDGLVISGKKPLLDVISTNWAVCAWLA